jgi:hypothetical protein
MCNGIKETKTILKSIKKLHDPLNNFKSGCIYFIDNPKYYLNELSNEISNLITKKSYG